MRSGTAADARITFAALAVSALAALTPARAEVAEVTVAQQYGVSFLPLMIMERDGLIEKQGARPASRT